MSALSAAVFALSCARFPCRVSSTELCVEVTDNWCPTLIAASLSGHCAWTVLYFLDFVCSCSGVSRWCRTERQFVRSAHCGAQQLSVASHQMNTTVTTPCLSAAHHRDLPGQDAFGHRASTVHRCHCHVHRCQIGPLCDCAFRDHSPRTEYLDTQSQ